MYTNISCTSKDQNYAYRWCPPEDPIYLPETSPRGRPESVIRNPKDFTSATQTCGNQYREQLNSSYLNFTPAVLRFPYNDPRLFNQRLTLWNRKLNVIKIRISSPDPETFRIQMQGTEPRSHHQLTLMGGEAKTFMIKCKPGRYKMARSHLLVFLKTANDDCECHHFPLEIFPSTVWFSLPKKIIIPEVIVGQKAHAIITLPQPKYEERFFVQFQPSFTPNNAVTLTPMEGSIGGRNGIRKLKVTYAPTEYTTVSCTIEVHFPGLSSTTSHQIQILGRCKPGKEAENIRKEVREIETFRPKPTKRNRIKPRVKLRRLRVMSSAFEQIDYNEKKAGRRMSYLFTVGGVMHFLTRKHVPEIYTQESKRKSAVEVLTAETELEPEEKVQLYEGIKKKLDLHGNDEVQDTDNLRMKKLKTYQKKDWDELQKMVGVPLFGKAEKLPGATSRGSHNSDHSNHGRRASGGSQRGSISSYRSDRSSLRAHRSISEQERQTNKNIVDEDPGPRQKFINAVATVITRWRADKRIEKLHELMEARMAKRRKSRKSNMTKKASIAHTRKSTNAPQDTENETRKSVVNGRKSVNLPHESGSNHSVEITHIHSPKPNTKRRTVKKSTNVRHSVKDTHAHVDKNDNPV